MSSNAHLFLAGVHRVVQMISGWAVTTSGRVTPTFIAALVVLSAACCAYAVVMFFTRTDGGLEEVLRPYRLIALPEPDEVRPRGMGLRPLVRRVGDTLIALVEARGGRPALELALVRAGLPIAAGEFLVACAAGAAALMIVAGLLMGIGGAIFGLVLGLTLPAALVKTRADRRHRSFNSQLPEVLKIVASSLRGGFSLLQSLTAVVSQCGDPIQHELRISMARIRLGEPIEDALGDVAERTGSRDFAWTVIAIRIQREVGGNLAEILDTVAGTMLERERLRREVRTLTAEGRASAVILAVLPIAIGLFIFVVNRPYMDTLLHSFSGQMALMVGAAMELFGAYWMHRTIQVEV